MGNKIICPEQCEHGSRWDLCQAYVAASLLASWPENIHEPLILWPHQQRHLISLSYQYVSLAPWWQKGPKTSLEKHSTFSNSTNTAQKAAASSSKQFFQVQRRTPFLQLHSVNSREVSSWKPLEGDIQALKNYSRALLQQMFIARLSQGFLILNSCCFFFLSRPLWDSKI